MNLHRADRPLSDWRDGGANPVSREISALVHTVSSDDRVVGSVSSDDRVVDSTALCAVVEYRAVSIVA